MTDDPILRLPTTLARERLAEIVRWVQDPRRHCLLTRHGRPVAAVVSLSQLERIMEARMRDVMRDAGAAPSTPRALREGRDWVTDREAGEALIKVQMDRLAERRLLARAGLEPVEGGEVAVDADIPEVRVPVAAPPAPEPGGEPAGPAAQTVTGRQPWRFLRWRGNP